MINAICTIGWQLSQQQNIYTCGLLSYKTIIRDLFEPNDTFRMLFDSENLYIYIGNKTWN